MFASPDTANVVFGMDGFSNVRPKGLFYIRFKRPILSGGENWRYGHGFFAKSVDLPTVTPQVEEINQYGKKRVIHTGIKYNPITLTFYDTVNSRAMQLWNEYAKYYFGDFNHATQTGWTDDITATYSDPEKTGYGFLSREATTGSNDGLNSQFFFECLEIFQVYGGTFIQTDIVNPKISSFEPDGVDYEDMSPLTIRMALTYEAIIYHNDGAPQPIGNDDGLQNVFSTEFAGDVFDPVLGSSVQRPFSSNGNSTASFLTSTFKDLLTGSSLGSALTTNLKQTLAQQTGIGSVLSQYGSFSYGNIVTQLVSGLGGSKYSTNRSSNVGQSLFDTDQVVSSLTGVIGVDSNLDISDEALGMANTFSDGTVQIGRKTSFIGFA